MMKPVTVDYRRFLKDFKGGGWFDAMVVEVPSKSASRKRKKVVLQYDWRKLVDPDSIRPPPPQDGGPERGFEVNEVESKRARLQEGWQETPQGHGVQVQKRKRGRPHKFVATSLKESNAEKLEKMADMDRGTEEPVVQTHHRNDLSDSQDATAGRTDAIEGNCNMEQAIVDISSNTNDEVQPLSTLSGAISPPIIEGSRLGSRVFANGVNDAQRQVDTEAEDRAILAKGGTPVDSSQGLPFEKRSSLWKIFESLDVFQEVTQNPHFHPLAGIKEDFREGTAIGIMVSYRSLFEKLSALQFDDPKGMLESTLDCLNDLEMHGFDVGFLRARLNKLSLLKGSQEQLLEESKNAERKLAESTDKKAKCRKVMDETNKKIAELQKQLLAVKSEDEKIDSDIAGFRRCIDGVQQQVANIQNEFKSVATTPLGRCRLSCT